MKFTFKTEKPTGRYRSFYSPHHYIKLKGVMVGTIGHEHPHKIRLMVVKDDIAEDGNPNCKWKWITLKVESESVMMAKAWLQEKIHTITQTFNLVTEN